MTDLSPRQKKRKTKAQPFLKRRGEYLVDNFSKVKSPCSIHTSCGGCSFLEISYEDELILKRTLLNELWEGSSCSECAKWEDVIASPKELGHRSKLALQLKHMRDGNVVLGTSPFGSKEVLPFTKCPVVMSNIESEVPNVVDAFKNRDLEGIKRACIVIRQDANNKVDWGGLGKGSLKRAPENALSFEYEGMTVKYDLNCFFQSNLSILPVLFKVLSEALPIDENTELYDLYGGVGLFSLMIGRKASKIYLIEENPDSLNFAQYNREANGLNQMQILKGRVENFLDCLIQSDERRRYAVIDPPRSGMSTSVREALKKCRHIEKLAYLSCNPESQLRDIKDLCDQGDWKIKRLIPFDFFPKSYHVESLIILERSETNP